MRVTVRMVEVIKNLDGRNSSPKDHTRGKPGQQKPRAEVTDGEYAAYLAGEYAMIARLVDSGVMQVDYAANLIDKPLSYVINLIRMWQRNDVAEQRDYARRKIIIETER